MPLKPLFRQIAGVWKPIVNWFGKPAACQDDGAAPRPPCCSECPAWLQCLLQSPLKLESAGFDFERWLAWTRLSSQAWFQSENGQPAFTEGPDATGYQAWSGAYVFEPIASDRLAASCGEIDPADPRRHCSPEGGIVTGLEDEHAAATHVSREGRTVHAPAACDGVIKTYYLNARVQCTTEGGVKGLRFFVILNWVFEGGPPPGCYVYEDGEQGTNPLAGCNLLAGTTFCGDDRDVGDCDEWGGEHRTCHAILESDFLPLDGLTWGDLQDVGLHPAADVAPYVYAGLVHSLFAREAGVYECNPTPPPETNWMGSYELQPCPIDGTGTVGDCAAPIETACFCLPPAIELLGAPDDDYKISVLAADCEMQSRCGTCDADGEPGGRAEAVEVDFAVSGDGCLKTFTALYPACLAPQAIFWSFGKTGSPVDHSIANVDPAAPTSPRETVTMHLVDARGCIYCASHDVTCGCCEPGASGSLGVTQTGPCSFELCATVAGSGDPDPCDFPFIEWQIAGDAPCEPDDDCTCDDYAPGAWNCCSNRLGNGQCTTVTIDDSALLRWRVWDSVCGCRGPWAEQTLACTYCECCSGAIAGAELTISGVGDNNPHNDDNCLCTAINGTYLAPVDPLAEWCEGYYEGVLDCDGDRIWRASWSITCDETGYWLELEFYVFPEIGPPRTASIFLGEDLPVCQEISGSYSWAAEMLDPGLNDCDAHSQLAIQYTFYGPP